MIVRVPVCARKRQRWTDARDSEKRHSTRGSADGKYTGSVVIARDLGRRTTEGESGESSVNSIRIALVYISAVRIRRERSTIADAAARISTARRADYERSGGIDGTPLPEVVLDSVGLPGAFGWVCLIAVSHGRAVPVF